MQFQIKRDILLKSLSVAHSVIERKNTLPILSNVLLEIKEKKLNIIATDLDLVFKDTISDLVVEKEGNTTISATILYDLLRKLPSNLDVVFSLQSENKTSITAENSKFNLLEIAFSHLKEGNILYKSLNEEYIDKEILIC